MKIKCLTCNKITEAKNIIVQFWNEEKKQWKGRKVIVCKECNDLFEKKGKNK